jgi:hypothetical protein
MAEQTASLFSFNRGIVSRLGLARVDIKRMALSAATMVNWVCRVLGSMSLRVGTQYLGSTYDNLAATYLPFIFSTTDTALLELTDSNMRVWINDALMSRPAVATAVINGDFAVSLASWTDNDEAGGASQWVLGLMAMEGNGTAAAIRDQVVSVPFLARGVEHALRIVIYRGPVTLRVGTVAGTDEYISETVLETGTHSLAFTPAGDFNVRFLSRRIPVVYVESCNVEAAGAVVIPTTWGAADVNNVRTDQSGDVLFVACAGQQQRRIERRATKSWSIVEYKTADGPFRVENVGPITLTTSSTSGNIIVTSSAALFKRGHIGALFSISSVGQNVSRSITAQNVFTNSIRITGIETSRYFNIIISGLTASGSTVTLQRSIAAPGVWEDVPGKTWTADATEAYSDTLDNQIIYYRIGIKTAGYVAGTIVATLSTSLGSITGIVRVYDFNSSTSVNAEVLTELGANAATDIWAEGEWSSYRGWPSAVALHEGRLWWAGKGKALGSISDAFDSFDQTFPGDAGPLSRSIGSGPVDTVNWMISLQRLMIGAQGKEFSVKSSSLDEPITPTNFSIKPVSSQGSAPVAPVTIDQRALYVGRSGTKVFELAFNAQAYDYSSNEITILVPDLAQSGIVAMDCGRNPDTRTHCVLANGMVNIAVTDKVEDVQAWIQFETDGYVEDVVVLPAASGNLDDQVYYLVRRVINGNTVRYLEKWAQEADCKGDQQMCKLADSFVTYSGVATTTITGLDHLEGEEVVVWADGADVGTDDSVTPWVQRYTVSGGQITLAVAASNVVVGLPYTGQFKSTKLGQATQEIQSPLNVQKSINHLGLILSDTHTKGLKYGPSFDVLDDLPGIEAGTTVTPGVREEYDESPIEFPGTWTTDSRICLQAQAPRPCTVLAATYDTEMHK